MNIVLIGYRASGKTTVGSLMARYLDWQQADTDRIIRRLCGMPIESFVAKKGWKGFRAIERNVLLSLAGGDSMVISTGGGAILHKEPFEMLREKSWVLWLDAEPETIRERMKAGNDIRKRPPLKGMDPLSEIEAVLSERKQVYRDLSHHTIRTDVKKPMEIAFSALMRFLACHGYQSPGSREGKSICLETP